jgi:hypothetical protein
MRRLAIAVVSVAVLLPVGGVAPGATAAEPASRSLVQPRLAVTVDNASQLAALFDDTVKWQGYTITLNNDIDMAGITLNKTIGDINRPFTSTFDGNGKTITNLTVDVSSAGLVDVGMFGDLGPGHLIKDLTLSGTITGESTAASAYVGGLAGFAAGGEVRNVVFVGEVTGESSGDFSNSVGGLIGDARDDTVTQAVVGEGSFVVARGGQPKVGGLIGYAERLIITRSASVATVQALDNTDTSRAPLAAGLIGRVFGRSTIRDTYYRGAVTSTLGTGWNLFTSLGGILGSTSNSSPNSVVDRSYAFASLTATGSWQFRYTGGIIGDDSTFNTSRSFYDDTLAVGSDAGGNSFDDTRLTTTQQVQYSSYAGVLPIVPTWEASTDDTVWGICDGQGYPYLLWQVNGDPCILTNTVSGTPQVGQVLTANADTAAVNDVLSYQWGWYDAGVFTRINETPFATYTVRSADVGHQLAVRVSSVSGTALATQISPPTSVVTTPPPPPPPPVYPPGVPTAVAALPGDASIEVNWTAPSFTGTFPITQYQVQTLPGSDGCLVTTTTCTLTGLTNGTTYAVQVRALNGAGWGAWSIPVEVTPEKPVQPTITIAPSQRGRFVRVDGTTTDLPEGTAVTAWVSMGRAEFAPMPKPVLVAFDGSFTWERRRNPRNQVRVYFSAYDRGVIQSNTVTFAGRR